MRIDLVTPFADKDKAKALGARWDATRKVWYIVDVADLTPFMRWIPQAGAGNATPPPRNKTAPAPSTAKTPVMEVPSCGCRVLPWEDCIHTTNSQ